MSTITARKRKLWPSRSGEGKKKMLAMRSAVARMQTSRAAVKPVPENVFTVAKGPGYEVKLVHVRRGTSPDYRTNCVADILCLNLEEFGLPEAVAWVRAVADGARGVMPSIAVLGSVEKLSRKELWQISHELEPAGAIFHNWLEGCRSFGEAFNALGKEISKTYGNPVIHCAGLPVAGVTMGSPSPV